VLRRREGVVQEVELVAQEVALVRVGGQLARHIPEEAYLVRARWPRTFLLPPAQPPSLHCMQGGTGRLKVAFSSKRRCACLGLCATKRRVPSPSALLQPDVVETMHLVTLAADLQQHDFRDFGCVYNPDDLRERGGGRFRRLQPEQRWL
jgi:hypothetical protein